MSYEDAMDLISKLSSDVRPFPTRGEIRDAYDAVKSKFGVDAEPLRTHIFGPNGLAIGPALGVRLSQFALDAAAPAPSGKSRILRI